MAAYDRAHKFNSVYSTFADTHWVMNRRRVKRQEIAEYLREKFVGESVDSCEEVCGGTYVDSNARFIIVDVNPVYWDKVVVPMLEYWGAAWDVDIKIAKTMGLDGGDNIKILQILIYWDQPYRGLR